MQIIHGALRTIQYLEPLASAASLWTSFASAKKSGGQARSKSLIKTAWKVSHLSLSLCMNTEGRVSQVMNGFSLNEREDLMSVASLPIVPGDDKDSPKRAVFVVGTAYIKPNEPLEPSSGRLVVYADSEEAPGKYWQAADVDVPGAAYSLTSVDGVIVAAVNTSVSAVSSMVTPIH